MSHSTQVTTPIRFATLLSPVLYETYAQVVSYIGQSLGCSTYLSAECTLEDVATNQVDLAFLCGLLYVHLAAHNMQSVELLVAPVLQGTRYQNRPIYFSDVVVRHDSPYTSLDTLQGGIWAYNECASHSGYNLTCYSLWQRGKGQHYFGQAIASGSHLQSLDLVLRGQAHATAIDSHLLDALLRQQPTLASQLRIIDTFGPSAIPPLVIAGSIDKSLKQRIQTILLEMHHDPLAARALDAGCIERLVSVRDEDYNDIRTMFAEVQSINFSLV